MSGPRPVSGAIVELELTGSVTPFRSGGPLLLRMPDTQPEDRYIAVFSTVEHMDRFFADYPEVGDYDAVKVIRDGQEFVDSILEAGHEWLHIIVNPHRHTNGKARYTELLPRGN